MLKTWQRIPPLVRIPMAYGILGGILSLAFAISFYYFGKHPFWINPFIDIRVFVIAIFLFFSLREVRDYFLDGILYFWQALGGCYIFLATMMLVSTLGLVVFVNYKPDFLNDYIDQGLQQLNSLNPDAIKEIGKPAVDELLKTLPNYTLQEMAKKYASQTLIIGTFITIIISVISRRQPKTQ
jgi:Protein of unknown function (DUF4199)